MTIRVLITCPQMQEGLDEFRPRFERHSIDVEMPRLEQQLDEDELLQIIGSFDGVIAGDDSFTRPVLERAERLRVISKWGVGIDNIDMESARSLGIVVTNTPGQFGPEVADVVAGYIVMLARRLHEIDRAVREGRWLKVQGISLRGKTLGVVGFGAVGRAVAQRGRALDMNVSATDPLLEAADAPGGVRVLPLEELLTVSDFVSLNCPLTEENVHMLSDERLALMKSSAYLINTARGRLVDEAALVRALTTGELGGAALDVFENEPLPADSHLRTLPNCILGSHNASNTAEASRRVNALALDNLLKGLGVE